MKRAGLAFGILLCTVVLVDCGSKILGDELATAASALDAKSAIVPTEAVGQTTVGETGGNFKVDESGQASYTLPLWTPEGPMGMAPSLALQYDSMGGDSESLGVGFSLRGNVISKITRCRKTLAVDNEVGPIRFDGNTYCLDGQRLVLINNSTSEYRTRLDDGSKIVRSGPDNAPTGFTVYKRDGQILTYGFDPTSQVTTAQLKGSMKPTQCNAADCTQVFGGATLNGTFVWALEKVADRAAQIPGAVNNGVGNYMKLTYTTSSSSGNIPPGTSKYGTDFDFKEMLLTQIDYGFGTGTTSHRKVVFTYGTTRSDARYTWVSGLPMMSTKLLSRIDMWGPNPIDTAVLKTYKLSYDAILTVSKRSRLSSIRECENETLSAVCKAPTQFAWEAGSNNFVDVVDPTPRSMDPGGALSVTDYNGDGKADVYFRSAMDTAGGSFFAFYTSQMGANITQSSIPSNPIRLEPSFFPSNLEAVVLALSPFDLDGDSRPDLMMAAAPGSFGGNPDKTAFDIYRNVGNGYGSIAQPPSNGVDPASPFPAIVTPIFADLDGSGLSEIIQPGTVETASAGGTDGNSQLVFRRNLAGTLTGRSALTDIARNQSFTIQTRVQWHTLSNGVNYAVTGYQPYVADIDASGRSALLIRDSWFRPNVTPRTNTSSHEMIAIQASSTGVVTSTRSTLAAYQRGVNGSHYLWLDVNGDGLPDAIDVANCGATATTMSKSAEEALDGIPRIRMNTGVGFKRYRGAISSGNPGTKYAPNAREDAGVMVADMNQDGLDDIVLMGEAIGSGVTHRSTVQLMIASTGTAQADHIVDGPALRMPNNNEIPVAVPLNKGVPLEASVPAALGDFNGDGLVDMVIARPATATTVNLHFYIHQGKKADQLTAVDTGTGRHLSIQYASVSDPGVYRRMRKSVASVPGEGQTGPWEQPSECGYQQNCLTSGMWVVSRYDVTNDQKLTAGHSMKYMEGRMPTRFGWAGFAERYDLDETDNVLEATSYDNRNPGNSHRYPFASRPLQVSKIVWDNGITGGTAAPHRFLTTNHYEEVNNVFAPVAYSTRLTDTATIEEILRGVPNALPVENFAFDTTTYSSDELANATTYLAYDSFDNVKSEKRIDALGDSQEKTYSLINDTTNWLMGKVISAGDISTRLGVQASRSHAYTHYAGTMLVNTHAIQGAPRNDVKLMTTYTRGAGALGQVTQETMTATSTFDDTSVPTGTVLQRSVTTTYDAVDGVTVASVTNPLNQKTLFAYHGGLGVLAQSEDPNGVLTSYEYDHFGRIRKRTVPTAGVYTVNYEATLPTMPSLIASTVAALGPVYAEHSKQVGGEETIVTYNMNGRELVRQTKAGDGNYRYVLTRYRPTPGRVALVSQPFRSTDTVLRQTFFTYDSLGRIVDILNPDSSRKKFSYAPRFGPHGFVTTTTDELGHVREEAQNDLGLIESVTEHPGSTSATTTYTYGPFDLLTQVTPPNVVSAGGTKGAPVSITYDELGRPVQETNGDAGTTTRSYNAFGEVVKEVDAMGTPTFFKRDGLGRISERSNARDGVNTFVWDSATCLPTVPPTCSKGVGKVTSSTSFDGTTVTNGYDAYGRPGTSTWNVQGRNYAIKQFYDATTGKVSEIDYPTAGTTGSAQLKVTYGYDSAGGVSSVTRAGLTTPYWKTTRWWTDGQRDQENDATGMVTTRGYDDNRRWPKSIKTAAGTTTIQNVTYGHDLAGNVTSRGDTDTVVNTSESFIYDETDKLKKWTFTASANTWTTDYAPGASGVIQQTKTGTGAQSLAYDYFNDAASQLPHAARKINTKAIAYDAKGRQASTFSNLTPGYSAFDLPKTISDAGGNILASYKYDAQNLRVFKSYSGQTTASIVGLYERRVSSSGVVSHVMYVRGPGKRVVAQETWTESGSSVTASPVLYHHDDIVGSTVVTNTTNTTSGVTRLRYDPFGLRINPTNPTQAPTTLPTKIGFTGHEMDDEFNLINMKGRIYDPKIARFLTPDPIVSSPWRGNGYDRYGYVLNNPLRYTDPSGFICVSGEIPTEAGCVYVGGGMVGPVVTVKAEDPTLGILRGTGGGNNTIGGGSLPDAGGGRGGGGDGGSSKYMPDYISVSFSFGVSWGPQGVISFDRHGNVYGAVGASGGASLSNVNGSVTAGYVMNDGRTEQAASEQQTTDVLTGPSVGVTAGGFANPFFVAEPVGVTVSNSPTNNFSTATTSVEVGVMTPQLGVSATYGRKLGSWGVRW
jgi:RHS repeat-associated protein